MLFHVMGGHKVEETVAVSNINDANRVRHEMGDIRALADSIKKFGIIQPIVINRPSSNGRCLLVAGGRRLAGMRMLGFQEVTHGKEFVWREEPDSDDGRLRLQAIELEENLRRSDLHWSEIILGKQRLFNLMRSIHGEATMGRGNEGFGVRSLAAMLGENPSTTSRDLELAVFVERHPMLTKLPTAADARRMLGVAVTVAAMQSLAKTSVVKVPSPSSSNQSGEATVGAEVAVGISAPALLTPKEERWCLYEGRFQDNITALDDNSIDLICTDLPYNIGLGDSSASHSAGLGGFSDSDIDIAVLCSDVAVQSYRVLRDNRFAVFFFGMSYYEVLRETLITADFTVDPYPFIWLRDRTAPPDGFARYSKTWDSALIASKGVPRFIRPNQGNSIAIPSVRGAERLHAAQKPVNVMQKFIEDMTTPGCIVLDMFAGAGTTGVAALNTRRKVVLFELEPANCVLIRSRLGVL
jgi:DNA modification methylase